MCKKTDWERCVEFHGHECPGLTIGYKASLYAIELLNLTFSEDENVVCVSENDACGIDAIQVLLGCSAGKGNLMFHITGKQAFSFYERTSGKSARICLKKRPTDMTREAVFTYYHSISPSEMFDLSETKITLPTKAKNFQSITCDTCGEETGENWIRLQANKNLCLDCYEAYNRFDI